MASHHFLKKILVTPAHLPTVMLIIGYPLFWMEMGVGSARDGVTSPLAWLLFTAISLLVFRASGPGWATGWSEIKQEWREQPLLIKCALTAAGVFGAAAIGVVIYASFFPPHLMQEYDVLNYHYTLPRQHLILGSFHHIPWSSADLWPLPIQFGFAPFWFVTELPNKVPQLISFLGLLAVSGSLLRQVTRGRLLSLVVMAAVVGTHGIGVQAGTAMLDLTMCYLVVAAWDSFLKGRLGLAAIEAGFFLWSKSFVPLLVGCILLLMMALVLLLKRFGFSPANGCLRESFRKDGKQFLLMLFAASLFVGGPFVAKSWHTSGTPFYPLGIGAFGPGENIDRSSAHWKSLEAAAEDHLGTRNAYGHGRSPTAFVQHLWLIAVPEKGVNNAFDYPLGLMFLLFLGPFASLAWRQFASRKYAWGVLFVMAYWASWWMGSQQSRFLFIPMVCLYLLVLADWQKVTKGLSVAMAIALMITTVSVVRSHKNDFGKTAEKVLRENDLQLVQMSRKYLKENGREVIVLDNVKAAYAQFPVKMSREQLPFILAQD